MDVKREGWVTTNGTPKNSAGEHEPSLDERYKNWPLPSKSACQWRAVHEVGRALWRTNAANRTDARRVFHDSKGGGNETSRLVPDVITYTKWVIIEGFRCALVFFRVCRVSNKLNYEPSARTSNEQTFHEFIQKSLQPSMPVQSDGKKGSKLCFVDTHARCEKLPQYDMM